jgi:hypothetical protein
LRSIRSGWSGAPSLQRRVQRASAAARQPAVGVVTGELGDQRQEIAMLGAACTAARLVDAARETGAGVVATVGAVDPSACAGLADPPWAGITARQAGGGGIAGDRAGWHAR